MREPFYIDHRGVPITQYEDEAGTGGFTHVASGLPRLLAQWGGDYDWIAKEELTKALKANDTVRFEKQAQEAFDKILPHCESPIEKVLAPWLICQRYWIFDYSPTVLLPHETALYVPLTIAVIPQLPIGNYRVDFALAGSRGGLIRFVVIECDGREFHDGIKNVKRDVDRDVRILANKRVLDVVRFDGRDIMASPQACALRAAATVQEAWRKGNPATAAKFEP